MRCCQYDPRQFVAQAFSYAATIDLPWGGAISIRRGRCLSHWVVSWSDRTTVDTHLPVSVRCPQVSWDHEK